MRLGRVRGGPSEHAIGLTSNATASVSFKMPLGDLSTLSMTIVAQPALSQATWTTAGSLQPSNMSCIIKTGSISAVDQDTKLVIQLPPGAAQDQTTCTSNAIGLRVHPASSPNPPDVVTPIKYNVTGLPPFVSVGQSPGPASPFAVPLLTFTFNVSAIRPLTGEQQHDHDRQPDRDEPDDDTHASGLADRRSRLLAGGGGKSDGTNAGNPIDFTVRCPRRRAGVRSSLGE